jgi:glucose/arabinose dehydrogenase
LKKRALSIIIVMFLLIGCSNKTVPVELSDSLLNQEITIVASNLQIPWAINKLGDVFYISEREGTIAKVEDGKVTRQQVNLNKPLSNAAEAGLLGFVLAPDFETSHLAYAYYTYETSNNPTNRIISLQYDGEAWTELDTLIDHIPSGAVHHGGRLKFGPDGYLYATTGDAADRDLAQDENILAGKILRLNVDGTIPDDNPVPNSYIYSLGHRNPQGLTWAPDGTLYATEHGNSAHDEVNIIRASSNYGWPLIQGTEERDEFVTPIFTSGVTTTWAPSGVAFYEDKLYVAALRGMAVLQFDLQTNSVKEYVTGLGRIRDLWIEEDTLYFVSNNTDGRGSPSDKDDQLYSIRLKR